MIRYEEAVELIRSRARALEVEELDPGRAMGRFLARRVESPVALPPFANSAMDGFALDAGGGELPAGTLRRVAGRIAAGDAPVATSGEERAWEIMTGAPVPEGLDAVVPVEKVEQVEEGEGDGPRSIRLTTSLAAGANVRPSGADFAPGDPVLEPGDRIDPAQLMALAALGIESVGVFRRPRAAAFPTGAELVDDPARELEPGMIRNSNGPFLTRALERAGAEVIRCRTLSDEPGPFIREVGGALDEGADLVISTGAVSMGRHDFVPRALEEMGAEILFHRAAIRPGKPVLVAALPGGALHFGLPGNPISAAVGVRFFVQPFLRALTGRGRERPWRMPLASAASKRPELRYFTRAVVRSEGDGVPEVEVLPAQQSFRIAPFLAAHAWAVLPEGVDEVEAGALVQVFGLYEELASHPEGGRP